MNVYRKLTAVLLSLTMLMMLPFSFSASFVYADEGDGESAASEEFQYQNLFYYQVVDGELHITRAVDDNHFNDQGEITLTDRCMITSLVIPETLPVNGVSYPVKYIDGSTWDGTGAFKDCFNLRSVKLPSSLISIGDKAFSACSSLTSVELPAGLEYLGCGAFASCTSLEEINIPAGCHTGGYAGEIAYPGPFYGDEALKKVTLDGGITSIDNAFFDHCGLTSIDIPDTVKSIGSNAFRSTDNLKTVNISPDSQLESIGWTAFSGSGITSFYIPDSVTYVDVGAFSGCDQLETVRVSESMACNGYQTERAYDTGIFNGCTALTNIIFPEGIEKIGWCWFFDSPITTITIPASVKRIEGSAFRYCLNLQEVKFEEGCQLESIGSYAFRKDEALTEFNFPETLKTLDSYAMEQTGLTSVELPSSLETMYAGVFNSCADLASVTIPAGMTYDWGYNNGAFEGCNSLKQVNFEKGVTRIDDGLFGWNDGLESISLPEGITYIGRRAFRRNHNLQSVVLPKSLQKIDSEAFSDCENLKTIKFKGERPEVNYSICEGVEANVLFNIWDKVPDNWGGTLTFIGRVSKEITEDMLYGEYNAYLENQTYKNISSLLYDNLFAGMANRSGFADWMSEAKNAMREGVFGSVQYIVKDRVGYSDYIMQKELATDLVIAIGGDEDIFENLNLKDVKNVNTGLKKYSGLLQKGKMFDDLIDDKNIPFEDRKEVVEDLRKLAKVFAPDDPKQQEQIVDNILYVSTHSDKYKKASKVFKAAGLTFSAVDAVLAAYTTMLAQQEIIEELQALIDKDSYLGKGLAGLAKDREKGFTINFVDNFLEKLADSTIGSKIESTLTEQMLGALCKKTTATELGGAIAISEFLYWGASFFVPGKTADEVVESWKAIAIANDLYSSGKAYRRTIAKNWENSGPKTLGEMKSEYTLLIEAYYWSMVNAAEHVKGCAPNAEKQAIEYSFKKIGDRLTYKKYIKSCLENANTAYLTDLAENGGVVITDIYKTNQGSGSGESTYIDIPAEIDGEPVVGVADEVFAGQTGISMISVPDTVTSIGNKSFSGCSSLDTVFIGDNVSSIGEKAFEDCTSLSSVDLPDNIEQIADDAFDGIPDLVITGGEDTPASDYASTHNIDFEPREKTVQSISVKTYPDKTEYRIDEELDKTGMTVEVTYSDGSTAVVGEGFACWIADRHVGTNTVKVMYGDCLTEFNVEITGAECSYDIYYLDESGNEVAEKTTGTAAVGETVTVNAKSVDGFTPDNESMDFTVGAYSELIFTYHKTPGISISDAEIECISETKYTGKQITPDVKVSMNGKLLTENTDYEVHYGSNLLGDGLISIDGIGAYDSFKIVTFRIKMDLKDSVITGISNKTYTGKALTQPLVVTLLGHKLTKGTDYTVAYKNNVKAGKATITITGTGDCKGSVVKTFTIAKARNSMKVKAKTANIKYSRLRKSPQNLSVGKVLRFTHKGQGTKKYVKTSGNKKIIINKKNGKVTVKKGLKKGTYRVKVKITAAGGANYKSLTKTVTFKIRVK